MSVLQINRLRVQRGQRQILTDLSLTLFAGELTILLGPNGSGKSTLLKCISAEIPFQGEITLFNQPQNTWNASALARKMAILPQSSSLSFAFLVHEVVMLGRLPHASSHAENQRIAHECLAVVGAQHLAKRLYTELSGGEKQRVHFARVLAQLGEKKQNTKQFREVEKSGPLPAEPQLLMLDEPTSALDLCHQHHTLQTAKDRAMAGDAVLVILHDLNLAARYADRILLLNNGTLYADGTPKQILTHDNIRHVFDIDTTIIPHPDIDSVLVA
ncbi:MAG: heme ABC transporter ATP-binding protein [Plesiomonas sp.]|uniref:heme ABC transporter ATP-binding protein n=1 Tax=Plesiomonas sp. TaxID=2486279 RepID=UPI003F372FF5